MELLDAFVNFIVTVCTSPRSRSPASILFSWYFISVLIRIGSFRSGDIWHLQWCFARGVGCDQCPRVRLLSLPISLFSNQVVNRYQWAIAIYRVRTCMYRLE
jgi:hypothetical protein